MVIDTPHVGDSSIPMTATKQKPFATKLREARSRSGLSQSQAAKQCNVPVKTFQNWEQDRATPSPIIQEFVLKKLANQ